MAGVESADEECEANEAPSAQLKAAVLGDLGPTISEMPPKDVGDLGAFFWAVGKIGLGGQ